MDAPDHTALGKGIMYHLAMERHYLAIKAGTDPVPEVHELLAEWRKAGRNYDTIDLVEWMYLGHLEMWGLDDDWEIVAVEYAFEFPMLDADGSPTGFSLKGKIDVIVRSRKTGRVFVVDHKCLDPNTAVPTPEGTRTVGSLKVGDQVLGSDGSWTKVNAVTRRTRPVLEIKLRNGQTFRSSPEHVWPVDSGYKSKKTEVPTSGLRPGHRLQPAPAYDLPDAEFSVTPYVLGAVLGDGGLTRPHVVSFTKNHRPTVDRVLGSLSDSDRYTLTSSDAKADTYEIYGDLPRRFQGMGLSEVSGAEKFIPKQYFAGSFAQRLELLRGLMDTDGSHRKGVPLYQTGSERLANDVARLVRSLGGTPTLWCNREPKYQGGVGKPCWDVKMRFPRGFPPVGYHEEKLSRWKIPTKSQQERLVVESVTEVGEYELVDIGVTAGDQLFVADGVLTHNSCAALPKQRELDLDDQMGLYLWGLRQLGKKPFGAIYSAARTKMNNGDKPGALEAWTAAKAAGEKPGVKPKVQELPERFSRTYLTRTNRELDVIAQEALATARAAYSAANQHQRHPDPDRCRWMCGYMEACLLGRKTNGERERQFLVDTNWQQRFRRH